MSVRDLAALPLPCLAFPDAVLFLWVTAPLLPDGLKGRPGIAADDAWNIPSVIRSRRGKHSAKPTEVYIAIEPMYPDLPQNRAIRPQPARWLDELGQPSHVTTAELEENICAPPHEK